MAADGIYQGTDCPRSELLNDGSADQLLDAHLVLIFERYLDPNTGFWVNQLDRNNQSIAAEIPVRVLYPPVPGIPRGLPCEEQPAVIPGKPIGPNERSGFLYFRPASIVFAIDARNTCPDTNAPRGPANTSAIRPRRRSRCGSSVLPVLIDGARSHEAAAAYIEQLVRP